MKINNNMTNIFSQMNTSAFSFTDYASIKNGSYGKLLKSYYAEQSKQAKTTTADTKKTTGKEEVTKQDVLSRLLDKSKVYSSDKAKTEDTKKTDEAVKTETTTAAKKSVLDDVLDRSKALYNANGTTQAAAAGTVFDATL